MSRQLVIFLLFAAISALFAYITRLPACGRYHGNFTNRDDGKYFRGEISATIWNVERKECMMHCVLSPGCLFFNHKKDNSKCELVTSHMGTIENNLEWQIVSTDYTSFDRKGPQCEYVSAECTFEYQHCYDTCEAPGFKCENRTNVALGKTVKFSSRHPQVAEALKQQVTDGTRKSFTTAYNEQDWIQVDLGTPYKIAFVTLERPFLSDWWNRMKTLEIRIGNNDETNFAANQVCKNNIDQSGSFVERYACDNGPITGRYVLVQRRGNMNYFMIAEIMVFTF